MREAFRKFALTRGWRTAEMMVVEEKGHMMLAAGTATLGDCLWWEPQIMEILKAGIKSLPTWTVRPELFPSPCGFNVFSQAIGTTTGRVLWGFGWLIDDAGPGFVFFDRTRDGRLMSVCMWACNWGEDIFRGTVRRQSDDAQRMLCIPGVALLFLEQKLAVSSIEMPSRATRRRFEKADIEYPPLRVISLRSVHRDGSSEELGGVDWQFRWMVRGHWRQQFYASDSSRRPIWITPYVKGPEDKPLKAPNQSVFAVVR